MLVFLHGLDAVVRVQENLNDKLISCGTPLECPHIADIHSSIPMMKINLFLYIHHYLTIGAVVSHTFMYCVVMDLFKVDSLR